MYKEVKIISIYVNGIGFIECEKGFAGIFYFTCFLELNAGNRQKSPWKKSFRRKVLKFHTKKSCGKSPFFKKSPEIKSYQFETLFSRTFFWLQYDFIQKSPRKKVL